MSLKHRLLAVLVVCGLPTAVALAQDPNVGDYAEPDRGSLTDRLGQFGRSLVGGSKRPTNNAPQRSTNNMPQRSTNVRPNPTNARPNQTASRPVTAQGRPAQPNEPSYDAPFGNDPAASEGAAVSRGNATPQYAPGNPPRGYSNPNTQRTPNNSPSAPPVAGAEPRGGMPTASRRTIVPGSATVATPAGIAPDAVANPSGPPPTATPRMARSDVGTGRVPSDLPPVSTTLPSTPSPKPTPAESTPVRRIGGPVVSVETVGPRKISIGKQAKFKLVLKNSGEMPASDVVVSVVVPDWAEVVDAKASTGTTEPLSSDTGRSLDGLQWKLGSIEPQSHQELALEVIPHKSQPLDLQVRWTQAPQAIQTTVEVQEPKLLLTLDGAKEVAFGERSNFVLKLSNPGSGDAENVTITLMPLNPSDGGPVSHPIGTLRPGDGKSIEIEMVARQSELVTIRAEATASGDLKSSLAQDVVVRRAGLDVAISGPKLVFSGTAAAYEIVVKNTGNAAAKQVKVACRLPQQANYLESTSAGQHSADANVVQWSVPSLQVGAEIRLATRCELRAAGQNKVDVSCTADGDLHQTATVSTAVEAVADLRMDISDPASPVAVGQEMTYEIRVRNRGTKSATGVDVIAFFSAGVEPVSVEGGAHEIKEGMVVFKSIPSVDMGQETVFKVKARADRAGNHRFRCEMTCKSLDMQLAQEENTLFYGETSSTAPTGKTK